MNDHQKCISSPTDNLSKEMQDDSFHKLQGNKKAFSIKVQSTEDYNRSVTAVENSYAHSVGFTSKSLGLPSDCRGPSWTSSSNFEEDDDGELDDEEEEDVCYILYSYVRSCINVFAYVVYAK
jgi:hypothetical protein